MAGRFIGPCGADFVKHVSQKIFPQWLQWTFRRCLLNGTLQPLHMKTSSSCCQRTLKNAATTKKITYSRDSELTISVRRLTIDCSSSCMIK
uniref:Uncharacterized protein n=1 Tax=Romanomermis culicivorax TaxID=13658 RepID=A0A915HTQ6_ROMCU